MQFKNILPSKGQKTIALVGKLAVTASSLTILFYQLKEKNLFYGQIEYPFDFKLILLILFLLMFLNWYLEALRWKISISSFEQLTIQEAIRDVLCGLTLNLIMPFTVGDAISRMATKEDKYKSTSALFLNKILLLAITFFYGIYGVMFKSEDNLIFEIPSFIFMFFLILTIFLLKKRLYKFTTYFKDLSRKLFIQISLISIVRYLIFTGQLFLIIYLFNGDLSIEIILAGIGCIFLARSALPSFLGGLGLRELSAYYFFEGFVDNVSTILFPVSIIWIINIAIPSIAGLAIIWISRGKAFNSSQA